MVVFLGLNGLEFELLDGDVDRLNVAAFNPATVLPLLAARETAMTFSLYRPGPPLDRWVEVFWWSESMPTTGRLERVLPDGAPALVMILGRRPENPAPEVTLPRERFLVVGSHARSFLIDPRDHGILGVHFRPGGLAPFLHCPAAEVRDLHVALSDLWHGDHYTSFEGDLREATTTSDRFRRLERGLCRVLREVSRERAAVDCAMTLLDRVPAHSVREVGDHLGWSAGRLIEVFRREVGLTPKVFQRVRRFQRVVRRMDADRSTDLVDLALGCGYWDQAHFHHEFRGFSGLTPGEYRERLPTLHSRNHIPLER